MPCVCHRVVADSRAILSEKIVCVQHVCVFAACTCRCICALACTRDCTRLGTPLGAGKSVICLIYPGLRSHLCQVSRTYQATAAIGCRPALFSPPPPLPFSLTLFLSSFFARRSFKTFGTDDGRLLVSGTVPFHYPSRRRY